MYIVADESWGETDSTTINFKEDFCSFLNICTYIYALYISGNTNHWNTRGIAINF